MNDRIAHLGLIEDRDIQIEIAALELSALDHEGVDLSSYLALFAAMEARLLHMAGDAYEGSDQARALSQVIAGEYGICGGDIDYEAPANADMIDVIDRRRGLPISLSILYVGMARRLGWKADALNMPGHVVVALSSRDAPHIVDPFARGQLLEPEQLLLLVGRKAGEVDYPREVQLSPMTNRMTLTRLLLNQASRAEKSAQPSRAMMLYERMTLVAPADPRGWWALARQRAAIGHAAGARSCLVAMLELVRDPVRRQRIVDAINDLD